MTSYSLLKEYSANKLKTLREMKNLTQEELAEELTKRKLEREKELFKNGKTNKIDDTPITRQTISKYENATIGMNQDILFDIAAIFKKNINDFFPTTIENGSQEMTDEEQEQWSKDMLENKNAKILFDKINEHKNLTKEDAQKIADLIDIITKDYEDNHD